MAARAHGKEEVSWLPYWQLAGSRSIGASLLLRAEHGAWQPRCAPASRENSAGRRREKKRAAE